MSKSNIVLIGMPSTGKSTVAKALANKLKMTFIDTDNVLKNNQGKELRDIVNEKGLDYFLKVQDETLINIHVENHVIATGGSVVYNSRGMQQLANDGFIIYLDTSLEVLLKRITPERRFARSSGQSYEDLYNERTPLYRKYADFIIECDGNTVENVVDAIAERYLLEVI